MNESITYSLLGQSENSNAYYQTIIQTARKMNRQMNDIMGSVLKEYQQFISSQKIEKVRTQAEYGVEFLTLGVLWKVYGFKAQQVKERNKRLIYGIVKRRQQAKLLRPAYSHIKGRLITKYLFQHDLEKEEMNKSVTVQQVRRLLSYLQASGEFEEEVKRLKPWSSFLDERPDAEGIMEKSQQLASFLLRLGKQNLSQYTANVTAFRKKSVVSHYNCEDLMLVQRAEIEYYLNMVGAEILNVTYRKDYLKTSKQFIFVPVCMSGQSTGQCKRQPVEKGYVCSGCTKDCHIHQVAAFAHSNEIETIIVEHGSQLYRTKAGGQEGETGVIGIACVLNLLSGGWLAKSLGYVPQCVLLDFCGCKSHWHDQGIVTQINFEQLKHHL